MVKKFKSCYHSCDERKPVIIKKGDPLFRVSFYPSDLNNGVNLSQEKDPTKIDYTWDEYIKKQTIGQQNKTWKPRLFSETGKSKCPFSFLFKWFLNIVIT